MNLSIHYLHNAYRQGTLTPRELISQLRLRIEAHRQHNAWITLVDDDYLAPLLDRLSGQSPNTLPLYGVPFAIKDNIDLHGITTTAACPDFSYQPETSATVVRQLIEAGAMPLGKTNLDQFATGLSGTRSPYGVVRNAFDPARISGGSSSGSAVAVALGEVSFALGTDTAGSGRVPAAFNNLYGVKPTHGRWSIQGIVPACRTLDCPSVFALNPADALRVSQVLDQTVDNVRQGFPVSGNTEQPRIGIPEKAQWQFFSDKTYAKAWQKWLDHLRERGVEIVEVDCSAFFAAADLLYQGPWVAERYHAVHDLLERHPESLLPVTREIIQQGKNFSALEAFDARYQLDELVARSRRALADVDALMMPTVGTHFTIEQLQQKPIENNTRLGYYTNFMNLLDLAALAMPAGFTADKMPFGVTLMGPAFSDQYLQVLAWKWALHKTLSMGALGIHWDGQSAPQAQGRIDVAVCGAHLTGMPLNHQLTERGAWLRLSTKTSPDYRLYALPGGPPERPALVRTAHRGTTIEVEVWSVPATALGGFVAEIPAPLGMGRVTLASGDEVVGFICEPSALEGAKDITAFGGWRNWRTNTA